MGKSSAIEWTDHTFNIAWGCEKVSPACDHCYAESWARRAGHDLWGNNKPRRVFRQDRQKGIHTHPWWCASFVFIGGYTERFLQRRLGSAGFEGEMVTRARGWLSAQFNPVDYVHIVPALHNDEPCWTLAILGPWEQEWGFPDVGQIVRDAKGKPVNKSDEHTACVPDPDEPDRCSVCRRSRAEWGRP